MRIAYIRVSTIEQSEQRQIEAMQKYEIEKWFTEKISAKDTNRPKLQEMLDFAREGDTIYIHDFSRLARSTKDLLNIVEQLNLKEEAQNVLNNAKTQMKELSERYSDYEHYPNLKGYYTTTSSFFDFCQNPTGSFEQVKDTINDYKNEARDYISDLDYIFED